MSEPPHDWPVRFQKFVAAIASLALALAVPGAAAPTIEREIPNSVTAVSKEMLDRLPANRDFRDILDLHNRTRAGVGAAPLRWNPALAANAQRYADTLARTGTVEHSTRLGRENERENIIVGNPSGLNPADLSKIWINEGRLFRPGTFPNVCAGDWSTCGHFTQIIWPTTTDVGCGYARARYQALVCRYSPPGNRDGVAIGPGASRPLADGGSRLCTTERGTVINCGNGDGANGGGITDDGGGTTERDDGDDEKACVVDVNVHRPISVDPAETVIPDARELKPGATTLRNDDSDWHLGGAVGDSTLPVISLPTDISRTGNADENDLVKVTAANPNGLDGVYVFAFPTHAEANRELATQVNLVGGGRVASADELAFFGSATKAPAAPGLPLAVPKGTTTFWTEALLGGQYRLVIGKLAPKVEVGAVRYNAEKEAAFAAGEEGPIPAFECDDQATLTAAVVDIYQQERSTRHTAFDVLWAGRPHFRAKLWPGDQRYRWGPQFRLGATLHTMPGTALDKPQKVAFTVADGEDSSTINASINGPALSASSKGKGSFAKKADIEGGFQIQSDRPGDVPAVNRAADDRYPHRVSLEYHVNEESLARAEYLEVILPRVRAPTVENNPSQGTTTSVSSQVRYTITDQFDRPLRAISVPDYLRLYGATIKAWEALGAEANRTEERGRWRDDLFITATGVDNRNNRLDPIGPLGTAQRSQADVDSDRMVEGTFQDRLVFSAGDNDNLHESMWKVATGRQHRDPAVTRKRLELAQEEAGDRMTAINQATTREQRDAIAQADLNRTRQSELIAVPQDVILQIRVGSERYDLMVFEGSRLRVFAPYFLHSGSYRGDRNDSVFRYHIRFDPGREVSRIVPIDYRRVPPPQRR